MYEVVTYGQVHLIRETTLRKINGTEIMAPFEGPQNSALFWCPFAKVENGALLEKGTIFNFFVEVFWKTVLFCSWALGHKGTVLLPFSMKRAPIFKTVSTGHCFGSVSFLSAPLYSTIGPYGGLIGPSSVHLMPCQLKSFFKNSWLVYHVYMGTASGR